MLTPYFSCFFEYPFAAFADGYVLEKKAHHTPAQKALVLSLMLIKGQKQIFLFVTHYLRSGFGKSVFSPDFLQIRNNTQAMSFLFKSIDI
jgi:hypothetical protein